MDTKLDPADYPVTEDDANERTPERPHRIRVSFYPHRWFHATAGELADHTAWGTLLEHDTGENDADETSQDNSEPDDAPPAATDVPASDSTDAPVDAAAAKTTPPAADSSATPPTKTAAKTKPA